MTGALIVIAICIIGYSIWERVDSVRQALDDIIYLLEEAAKSHRPR